MKPYSLVQTSNKGNLGYLSHSESKILEMSLFFLSLKQADCCEALFYSV